jgi:glutamate-1-semialdehyde 2,1-aminomutase
MADGAGESRILAAYRARTRRSRELHEKATHLLPSGIVHDSRRTLPYGIYAVRGAASRKWDVDGNEYVDYYGGHGALLLGHQHPDVIRAIQAQLGKGLHLAASNELEIEWARCIQEMVPSAERVRFTSSGTEATQLAMRLARASTGRSRIVRFQTHFHGWHDQVAFGVTEHLDGSPSVGVLREVADNTTLIAPNDVGSVERVIATERDVAAVMVEPIGSSSGAIPTSPEVLGALREVTQKHGVLLTFDEVVTGFRVSPGGAQALHGVIPDLTTMAKIVAGGMPGGAVGGRKDILDWLDFEAAATAGHERISHQGTHNAHPLSAAAGITTLNLIRSSDACAKASATAAALRHGMNDVLEDEGVPWAIYGEHSFFHIYTNPAGTSLDPTAFDSSALGIDSFKGKNENALARLRLAMLVNGVDLKGWRGGIVSAVHTAADVEFTVEAWRKSLRALKDEGELPLATRG